MKKHFYSSIIEMESVYVELDGMPFSQEQKDHLLELIDLNMHHAILEIILSGLEEEDKKIFLKHLAEEKHDKIWILLNSKTNNIENKIKKVWEVLKDQFFNDIKEAKEKKG